jgi:hypothetical protein
MAIIFYVLYVGWPTRKKAKKILVLNEVSLLLGPVCPGGGIGRRAGLKHQCSQEHAGSTPALGT